MGKNTAIGWCDHTFNPWWGCARVSPGCRFCYAESFARRTGHDVWGEGGARRKLSEKHWREPLRWNADAVATFGRPARVFCASMADVFEDHPAVVEERGRVFELIEDSPDLRWLLLTKRPANIGPLARPWVGSGPLRTVWLGTTVEDQQRADERIPELVEAKHELGAAVAFLSCEPLLGPVELFDLELLDWIIVGGESGPNHRPLDLVAARRLVDQATEAGVPVFFKQVGGLRPTSGGDQLDGREWKEFPR